MESAPRAPLPPLLVALLVRAGLSAVLVLAVIAGVAALGRVAPPDAVRALTTGAFGSPSAWELTLRRGTPILLTGLAVAWAFRAGLFNIGAEGQLLWGALAAGWVAYAAPMPPVLHVTASLAVGALAGALWALPAAVLKIRRGVPEVITTLLLGFTAEHLTRFMANGPLHDAAKQGPRTPDALPSALLPPLAGSLHVGVVLAAAAAGLLALMLARSPFGFQLRVVGRNPEAARTSRINVSRVWGLTLLQSGALAGLAGAVEVLGVHRFFQAGFSPGYGFEGIAVAILGAGNPGGVVVSAFFWGALANGAVEMEMSTGLSRYVVSVIQALVILAVAVRQWPVPRGPRRAVVPDTGAHPAPPTTGGGDGRARPPAEEAG